MSELVDLIESTVKLEQPLPGGLRTVGTGFIISDRTADGGPRTVLITANHVLARMPQHQATVGFRVMRADGAWSYAPKHVEIRSASGDPLWTRHPVQDVAAIEIPTEVAIASIPISYLAGKEALKDLDIEPGDEMIVLGFPRGISANPAGFPILRSGRVASYPIAPAARYPTFLIDFSVFAGNSGGPVFFSRQRGPGGPSAPAVQRSVVGILTQQIKLEGDRLAIGNVTQAKYVVETLSLMDADRAVVTVTEATSSIGDIVPATASPPPKSWRERTLDSLSSMAFRVRTSAVKAWILFRDLFTAWTTPLPVAAPSQADSPS